MRIGDSELTRLLLHELDGAVIIPQTIAGDRRVVIGR